MKHDHPILAGFAAHRRAVSTVVAAAALMAPLLFGSSAAVAESRGYVISWFSVATNNPDFAVNCPRTVKDQISRIGKRRERPLSSMARRSRRSTIRTRCRKNPISRRWWASTPTGSISAVPRPPNSLIPRRTRRWTTSSGARLDAPRIFSSRRPRCPTWRGRPGIPVTPTTPRPGRCRSAARISTRMGR